LEASDYALQLGEVIDATFELKPQRTRRRFAVRQVAERLKSLDVSLVVRRAVDRVGEPVTQDRSRGAGVGGLLLELCCSALAEAGVRHVFLHAAAEDGWEAKLASFYERHGFAEFADVSDAYPVMYRRLRRKA